MSFGLRKAPATLQGLMNRLVLGLEGVAVYLDDVVVFNDSLDKHLSRIADLFSRFGEAGLTVKFGQMWVCQGHSDLLGKGRWTGLCAPSSGQGWGHWSISSPTTKKELMRFWGFEGYYRGFCGNVSTIVSPLSDLLKTKVAFVWTSVCQKAFEAAKSVLVSAPVLAAPQFDLPFSLCVDASNVGGGSCIVTGWWCRHSPSS